MTLEAEFNQAMIQIYQNAKKQCGYNATRFLQMVSEQGGVNTAKRLLAKEEPSDGFAQLWQSGRLDLTVEALVISARFSPLFSPAELKIARERLLALNYQC